MKRTIISICSILLGVGLTAFVVSNHESTEREAKCNLPSEATTTDIKETPDFYFGVGPRFNPITRTELSKIVSFRDFVHPEENLRIAKVIDTKIIKIENEAQTNFFQYQKGELLSWFQLNMLKETELSGNFCISANCQVKHEISGKLEDRSYNPHHTLVPDEQATYKLGEEALLSYLRENSAESIKIVDQEKRSSAKVYFTITSKGELTAIRLTGTTGYSSIDDRLLELIANLPSDWNPAKDEHGNTVEQELVFTFGNEGC